MTTTIRKTRERSYRTGRVHSRVAVRLGRGQPTPGSIDLEFEELVEEAAASPASALVAGARDIVPVLIALFPFGVAFGATAIESGPSAVEALGMSVFVFAGAAQLATLPLLSAGWKDLLSYLLTDQAYAATITRFDEGQTREPDKRWYYLGVGLAIWVAFQAATMTGVFLGALMSDGLSLDFVLPLIFIGLAVPTIKSLTTGAAAISAGVAAIFFAALPLNLGLISAALVGVLGGLVAETVIEVRRR